MRRRPPQRKVLHKEDERSHEHREISARKTANVLLGQAPQRFRRILILIAANMSGKRGPKRVPRCFVSQNK